MGHHRVASRSSSEAGTRVDTLPLPNPLAHDDDISLDPLDAVSNQQRSQDHGLQQTKSPVSPPEYRGLVARRRSVLRLITEFLPRWLLMLAIACSIYGVLVHYAKKKVVSQSAKRGFNTVITGLAIAQSLVLVASLNAMVGDLRWWILSRRLRSRRQVESILRANSVLQSVNLAFKSKRPKIYVGVIVWLLVVLGSQIAVASLNLCYSTGAAETYALTVNGDITVPDMSTIYTDKLVPSNARTLGAVQYTANSYGIVSTAYWVFSEDQLPAAGTIFYPGDAFIFQGNTTYLYLFRETSVASSVQSGIWATAIATNRTAKASAVCRSWPVTAGGNGAGRSITVVGDEGEFNVSIPLAGGTDQTTYMTNINETCGRGCSPVTAFEAKDEDPWYYRCNVTVHPVANATRAEHEISQSVAKLATSAIALQGYGISSLATNNMSQFQSYPLEAVFGSTANGSTSNMADLLSRFTIGVVAAVAESNEPWTIRNTKAPEQGVQITITHRAVVILILVGLVGFQLALELLTAVVSYRSVVPPRGALATAQVLRAMTVEDTQLRSAKLRSATSDRSSKGQLEGRVVASLWAYRATPVAGRDVYDMGMEKSSG